jgi:DNA-binding GntR family transcriptional regulator
MPATLPDPPEDLSYTFESRQASTTLSSTPPVFLVLKTRFLRDRAPKRFWVRANQEHKRICAAIAVGDGDAAETEMRDHLRHLRSLYEKIDRRRFD